MHWFILVLIICFQNFSSSFAARQTVRFSTLERLTYKHLHRQSDMRAAPLSDIASKRVGNAQEALSSAYAEASIVHWLSRKNYRNEGFKEAKDKVEFVQDILGHSQKSRYPYENPVMLYHLLSEHGQGAPWSSGDIPNMGFRLLNIEDPTAQQNLRAFLDQYPQVEGIFDQLVKESSLRTGRSFSSGIGHSLPTTAASSPSRGIGRGIGHPFSLNKRGMGHSLSSGKGHSPFDAGSSSALDASRRAELEALQSRLAEKEHESLRRESALADQAKALEERLARVETRSKELDALSHRLQRGSDDAQSRASDAEALAAAKSREVGMLKQERAALDQRLRDLETEAARAKSLDRQLDLAKQETASHAEIVERAALAEQRLQELGKNLEALRLQSSKRLQEVRTEAQAALGRAMAEVDTAKRRLAEQVLENKQKDQARVMQDGQAAEALRAALQGKKAAEVEAEGLREQLARVAASAALGVENLAGRSAAAALDDSASQAARRVSPSGSSSQRRSAWDTLGDDDTFDADLISTGELSDGGASPSGRVSSGSEQGSFGRWAALVPDAVPTSLYGGSASMEELPTGAAVLASSLGGAPSAASKRVAALRGSASSASLPEKATKGIRRRVKPGSARGRSTQRIGGGYTRRKADGYAVRHRRHKAQSLDSPAIVASAKVSGASGKLASRVNGILSSGGTSRYLRGVRVSSQELGSALSSKGLAIESQLPVEALNRAVTNAGAQVARGNKTGASQLLIKYVVEEVAYWNAAKGAEEVLTRLPFRNLRIKTVQSKKGFALEVFDFGSSSPDDVVMSVAPSIKKAESSEAMAKRDIEEAIVSAVRERAIASRVKSKSARASGILSAQMNSRSIQHILGPGSSDPDKRLLHWLGDAALPRGPSLNVRLRVLARDYIRRKQNAAGI